MEPQVETLQTLAKSNQRVHDFFAYMSMRKRSHKLQSTVKLQKGLKDVGVIMTSAEIVDVLLRLQSHGWGKCRYGNKGQIDYFEFNKEPIYNVGLLALGEKPRELGEKHMAPAPKPAKPKQERRVQPRPIEQRPTYVVAVRLSSGQYFKTMVPASLSAADAKLIADTIRDIGGMSG